MKEFRIGIDIGGTFTDLVAVDEQSGEIFTAKVPTTPSDRTRGFVDVLKRFFADSGNPPACVSMIVHGTTTATNAVLERKLPRVAVVTTKGFRDVLEIGRRLRKELYNLFIDKPELIVERRLRFEMDERTTHDGTILKEIGPQEMAEVVGQIESADVKAVAVCFINSYANPENEKLVRQRLSQNRDLYVSASFEVCREFREYERTSTTVVNAALMPVVSAYMDSLKRTVSEINAGSSVFIMQSNGGVATVEATKQAPANLLLSGPAGGVTACQYLGELIDCRNIIGFDMGGTSTDVSVIVDGKPTVSTEGEVAGFPVKIPMIDINTIGAGGGSIAWIDRGGALRVGPKSAGADPGPVCYGKGGTDPTVTDANVLLGRIDPSYFLGGEIKLNANLARAQIQGLADVLNMDAVSLAEGIVRIADANMERAIRVSSVEKGLDPRDFVLVAFGGAGPLHASSLAQMLEIPQVVVPLACSELSALGLLATDIRHDHVVTRIMRSNRLNVAEVEGIFRELEDAARDQLSRQGVRRESMRILRSVDMMYAGQAFEINVPLRGREVTDLTIGELIDGYHEAHRTLYAHSFPDRLVDLVNFRVTSLGVMNRCKIGSDVALSDADPDRALKSTRQVYFSEVGGFCDCRIFDRRRLKAGNVVEGPAIIEQPDSTTTVLPGYHASVDPFRNLVITKP